MGKKLTQDEVIKQFKDRHGYEYIYDKVCYVNEKTKVLIGCRVEGHRYFEQTPDCHKRGAGCPKCGGKLKLTDADVKDINKLANQDYEGHKNTQEFLMEVKDELKESRK